MGITNESKESISLKKFKKNYHYGNSNERGKVYA